jgi:outer membrane protein OmpA-like peptidoglycan-associated protein
MPDIATCLAPLGLALDPLPAAPAPEAVPAAPEAAPVPAEAPVTPPVDPAAPAAEAPAVTPEGQPVEVVEELPPGITQEQLAPVLDSAKDIDAAPAVAVDGAAPAVEVTAAPEAPPAPAPVSDVAAQSEEIRALSDAPLVPLAQEAGTAITAVEGTTITQTVTNNYLTSITTNVTQNNIGQQNNVTIIEEAPVREATAGDLITQVILQVGTQLVVNSIGQDTDRFYNPQQDEVYYEDLPRGRVREVVSRPDGSQVVTVRNRNGDVLRRSRITPDGREIVLAYFDDRYDEDLLVWRDPGQDLPPLRLNIPVREYVLDAAYADEADVQTFFRQPPVEQVARLYSIDEVKRSARVRDSVRRLEVGNLTFDTGAATINRDQVSSLSNVANAMLDLLETNPAETFLIEGHTDAVGSDISNLRLSDLRAATVARILTDFYAVPPENLATQGYGERYLKIRTDSAERENRRVTIRRITPLITVASN